MQYACMQIVESSNKKDDSYSLQILKDSIYSNSTKETYVYSLIQFIKFHNIENCDLLLQFEKNKVVELIRNYLLYLRNERKLSYSRINIFFSAVRLFYIQNDYEAELPWSKLARFKGKYTAKVIEDRTYTVEEIQRLLDYADLRMKVSILVMLSSGIRVGGLASLRLKDLIEIEQYNLYLIKVYSDSPNDSYFTYCTPEATKYIKMYLVYRQNQGEQLNPNSPLIRQKFDCVKDTRVTSEDIQERMRCLLINSGILPKKKKDYSKDRKIWNYIEKSDSKKHRNEVMRCHGLRKFFNTVCIESDMNIVSKELLMGHKKNLGLEKSYYRPTSDKLLKEYLKVLDNLTINDENRLKQKVKQQQEELQENKQQFANIYRMIEEIKKSEDSS
jgi:integrase